MAWIRRRETVGVKVGGLQVGGGAPVVVQSISVQSQVVTLQWQAAAGQQFQVQSSSDLATWQTNAVNVTSATATYTWSGPATARRQFFRLAK